jgi:hypothetical protein
MANARWNLNKTTKECPAPQSEAPTLLLTPFSTHLSFRWTLPLKFLLWGWKAFKFLFVSNLIWGCSKCVQIALFASWNNSVSQRLFLIGCLISHIYSIIALFVSWKLLELLYLGPEHRLERIVSSTSVQFLKRAAPATFRTQIEQIRTHLEQPQMGSKPNGKCERFWSLT